MICWFRGQLEASYVGDESKLSRPAQVQVGKQFHPRVYRAAVSAIVLIEPPPDARPPVIDGDGPASAAPVSAAPPSAAPHGAVFRQPRIDEAHVAEPRGPGSYFTGPLFDVRVSDVQLSHPVEKNGRAYGRMVGEIIACCVLPELPEPERVPPSETAKAEPAAAGVLHVEEPEEPAGEADPEQADVLAGDTAGPAPREEATGSLVARLSTGLSLFSCAMLVAVALGLRCGVTPVVLWCVFILPTLIARRMLRGVLPDGLATRLVGGALVLVQVASVSFLVADWWSADCKTLALGPLLGVVVVLFPAGVLPSALPFACNAAGLALVLFSWCSGPSPRCAPMEQAGVSAR